MNDSTTISLEGEHVAIVSADRILDHAAKATVIEDIKACIAELERAVNPTDEDSEPE